MKKVKSVRETVFRPTALRWWLLATIIAFATGRAAADDFYILSSMTTWDNNYLYNDSYKMTSSGSEWTWSFTPTSSGDVYFRILGRWSGGWYDYGIAPSTDGTSVTTSYQNSAWDNTYAWKLTVTAGSTYTLYKNSSNQVKYSATTPVTYYVKGDNTSIFPNGWNTGSSTAMTDNCDTYSWTTTGIHLDAATYSYKVYGDDGSWYPSGNNATFSVSVPGTYNLTITFDGSTVTATPTLVQADQTYEYDLYIRYTGSESLSNVYAYGWDSNGNDVLGNWGGTSLSSMTAVTVNGYTYYHITLSSAYQSLGIILNENASSSTQTANLTINPGDNYLTYGGGSTVDGPNSEADALRTYYIEGSAGLGLTWDYAPAAQMTYDAATGLYSYTCTVAGNGTYSFIFANGRGSDWDDFNGNYRIGPASGDQTVLLDGQWVSTQMADGDNGSYSITLGAGTTTIYFDSANMLFKVEGNAPGYGYTFYVLPSTDVTPHLYLWNGSDNPNGTWPGAALTTTETLADGNTWYKWTGTLEYNTLNAQVNGGTNTTQTANIENLSPDTYYITWNTATNEYEITTVVPFYLHGSYSYNGERHSYSSGDGTVMRYDMATDAYYLNNVTLSSNATFCFTTALGNDWSSVGTRYGNGGDEYTELTDGTNYLGVTDAKINTQMPMGVWSDTRGEYKMLTAGVYNMIVSRTQGWVKLIKTDNATLSPMNVYLEQTDNVVIDNIQEPGTTYTSGIFGSDDTDYWPLSAYNFKQGFWNPTGDGQHYNVKYVGDTTTVDGKKWWHWQVTASICEVFFTRTNKEPFQSDTIKRRAGVLWYTWDEENGNTVMTDHTREYFDASATALPTNAEVIEGHYYVYFINTLGWENVYINAWYNNGDTYVDGYGRDVATWPGQACERVGIDPVTGYEVWRYDFGTISGTNVPDGILFNDGNPDALSDTKEQTGDFDFVNGGVYDYLGLFDGAYTLNNLIRTGAQNVRYTISNDLLGVYYDNDAVTRIYYTDTDGHNTYEDVTGALYAKDLNLYGEKSIRPDSTYTDYVYDICASSHTAGRSQIMDKRTSYDQSNWVKLVVSPNYDGRGNVPVAKGKRPYLGDFVGRIIPAGQLDVFMTDSINPTAHVMSIAKGSERSYEPNVYVSAHFNDTIVYSYAHTEWQPGSYSGTYRTKPTVTWHYDNNGNVTHGTVTRSLVEESPYKMFYVAPKPQEIAYITWVVYDNNNDDNTYPGYSHGTYSPVTQAAMSQPNDPGRFYAPRNWDRSVVIDGAYYNDLMYLSDNELETWLGGYGQEFGPYSNGYMQYGAVKVNWSLFGDSINHVVKVDGEEFAWWQIFEPGQAYKIKALIRYARGNGEGYANNECYAPGNGDETGGDKVNVRNAPRRAATGDNRYANMYFTDDYSLSGLDASKFIIFPLEASPAGSNGSDMGNVTSVEEVTKAREVVAVRYYNLMGSGSDKPFDGINIVVTTYSDGSRQSRKVLR